MSAWGQPPKTGAWAAQVDEEEEENGGELAPPPAVEFPALGGDAQAFPSLGETAGMKESKRDRKKRQVQKMSLGAFVSAGRKEVDVVNLPTAPRARADGDEEKKDGLGGGFRNYGGDRGGEPLILLFHQIPERDAAYCAETADSMLFASVVCNSAQYRL